MMNEQLKAVQRTILLALHGIGLDLPQSLQFLVGFFIGLCRELHLDPQGYLEGCLRDLAEEEKPASVH